MGKMDMRVNSGLISSPHDSLFCEMKAQALFFEPLLRGLPLESAHRFSSPAALSHHCWLKHVPRAYEAPRLGSLRSQNSLFIPFITREGW